MNMIKVLRRRFQQCLGAFTMLLVKALAETGLFRHLSDYVFGDRNFEKTKLMTESFDSKSLKFNLDFENAAKN